MAVVFSGPGVMYIGMSTGTAATWQGWNQAYATTVTSSTVTINAQSWGTWNQAYDNTTERAAEREAADARMRERREQQRRDQEERRELARQAQARAEELLVALLTDEQAASRREHGWFAVRGSASKRVYRIHATGIANNVDRLGDDGKRERVFCAHPPGVPAADVHLAQLLSLATDEDAFLRVANSHVPHPVAA